MPFESGQPSFGLRDGKIGTWAGDGTYPDPVDIFGIRILGVQEETQAVDLEGDDTILATQTVIQKGTVTLEFASVQFEIVQRLTGQAQEYGTGYTRQRVTTRNPPYVGLCGKALAAEGGGDTHLFIPKCKASSGFQVRFERGAFAIPSITFTAVADDNFEDGDGYPLLFLMDEHDVPATIALPPVGL